MDEASRWMAKATIAELITRYAALSDAGDWDAVAALYREDGRMSRPTAPDDFIAGRAAILEAFRARPPRAARHIVANVLVTLNGDSEAHATSQILLFSGVAQGPGPPVQATAPPIVGTYRDHLRLVDRRWQFVERRGSLDFRTPK
jgi:ketosteroid isomerase-like protein